MIEEGKREKKPHTLLDIIELQSQVNLNRPEVASRGRFSFAFIFTAKCFSLKLPDDILLILSITCPVA